MSDGTLSTPHSETSSGAPEAAGADPPVPPPDDTINLSRIAWSVTTFVFLLAGLALLVDSYLGYGIVTLAVAFAAAINLT